MLLGLKNFLVPLLQSIIFWILAFMLFAFIRFYGIEEDMHFFSDEALDISVKIFLNMAISLGLFIGVFYAVIDFLFDAISKRMTLGLVILSKTLLFFIFIIFSLTFISFHFERIIDIDLPNDKPLWWVESKIFWTVLIFFVISSTVFSFLKIVNNKFGKSVFFNILIGKYKKPQEERRIFMFLDLKDSTKIAEELGHISYSQFIQDCFFDLNSVVDTYSAEIYQYVGDEAVLSWPYKRGIKSNNCIQLFFAFKAVLEKKTAYYLQKYKQLPKFKAGLHGGNLIVAEVGSVKKELAYHGDVINTTARIQSKCNAYNKDLLISDALLNNLEFKTSLETKPLGDVFFKGKKMPVHLSYIDYSLFY